MARANPTQTEPARVAIIAADMPGLYDLYFSDGRDFRDMTVVQTTQILRDNGWDPAKVWAMPRG